MDARNAVAVSRYRNVLYRMRFGQLKAAAAAMLTVISVTQAGTPANPLQQPARATTVADHPRRGARYPTSDEVYYVLSCMEMNGHDANGLHRCSCAINALERRLTYDQYLDASMVVALRVGGGRKGAIFRDTGPMKQIVADFVRAQQAANHQCFGAGKEAVALSSPGGYADSIHKMPSR